jgi:hypothetical protein
MLRYRTNHHPHFMTNRLCIICGPRIALRPLSGAYKLHRVQRLGDEVSPISIYKFYVIGTWVVLFMGHTKHDILARPEARHDTINFGPCRHDTNARAVPRLGSRHDERHGTTHILGRDWAGTARKWPICKSIGYSFLIACVICII